MHKRQNLLRMFIFICGVFCSSMVLAQNKPRTVAGELLVKTKPWVSELKAEAAIMGQGTVMGEIPQIKVKRLEVPAHALEQVKRALSRSGKFSFVEENYILTADYEPNDERYASQWHLPRIFGPEGWDMSFGSSEEVIAVIDSGVDASHPDLGSKVVAGHNFLTGGADTADGYGHGTAVSGSAAALSDNVDGIAGVAWENPIMPLVVLGSDGTGSYADLANALIYAADHGVRIINVSISGPSSSYALQDAVDYAWEKGSVIVASAGNYGSSELRYPAACEHVLAVSATDSKENLASFSSYGSWIDLSAPGVSILTTIRGGGYQRKSGTSFSSPITAGVVALMFSENSDLQNSEVVDLLLGSLDDLGQPGFDQEYGHGRLNVYTAVQAALDAGSGAVDNTPPTVSVTDPQDGDSVSGLVTLRAQAEDNVGIEYVDFYVNGSLLGSDTASPFSLDWDSGKAGTGLRELYARALDTSGNVSFSAKINVLVTVNQDFFCQGDFDFDGDVDGLDLSTFSADFGRTDCHGGCKGDFDQDGDVDGTDLSSFSADFGRTDCP